MSEERPIVVVTKDAPTASLIASAMDSADTMTVSGTCRDLHELTSTLERSSATAVVVDVDPEPERTLNELDPVISRFPDVRFVVVCETLRHELILQAMQVGARHFLRKADIAVDLRSVIDRVAPNGKLTRRRKSTQVTVLSGGGGSGATTIAVNLANELRVATEQPSLIVDMDCCYGSVAVHLGVEGMYGLAEVLCEDRSIDVELIRSTVVHHNNGPDVLMNPATLHSAEPAQLDLTNVSPMLRACREAYSHLVIDAPRLPIEVAAELARGSLVTLLIFQCSVRDLRIAKATLSELLQRGVASETILPVVNRYRRRYGTISLNDAQRVLGEKRIGTISNDFASAQKAQNYGQLLDECAPRSSLRRDIRSLAASLIEAHRNNTTVRDW